MKRKQSGPEIEPGSPCPLPTKIWFGFIVYQQLVVIWFQILFIDIYWIYVFLKHFPDKILNEPEYIFVQLNGFSFFYLI